MKKELIELFNLYLKETKKARTVIWTDLESKDMKGKKEVELKGDFHSFIKWLETKPK